jgi:hypothetical protein
LTNLTLLTPGSIFIKKEIIDTTIASAAGTMFRQVHDTSMTDYTNKKHLRVDESIGAGELRIRKV